MNNNRANRNNNAAAQDLAAAPRGSDETFAATMASLENDGVAVHPGVLTREECAELRSRLRQVVEGAGSGIDRNNAATWTRGAWPVNLHGIFQYAVGHEQLVWDVRQHPAVLSVFQRLWQHFGCTPEEAGDLLVSFDGACVMPAPEYTKSWGLQPENP